LISQIAIQVNLKKIGVNASARTTEVMKREMIAMDEWPPINNDELFKLSFDGSISQSYCQLIIDNLQFLFWPLEFAN
jgi:hypothetical protein